MTMTELVTVDRHGATAIVTLNRPEAMNALSAPLKSQLAQTMDKLEADTDIRVVILTGAGERAFTAGLDLKELGENADGPAIAITTDDPVKSIGRFSGPVIGAINGVAITGGFEIGFVFRCCYRHAQHALCRYPCPCRYFARLGLQPQTHPLIGPIAR